MGLGEIVVILLIALLVFGPERLPSMIKEAAAFIRDLRKMVARARSDLSTSVGDLGLDQEDLDLLRDLRNPKSFIRQKVLDGADLGLDDPELAEALNLDDKPARKPKSTARKTTPRKTATAAVAGGSAAAAVTAGADAAAGERNGHAVAPPGDVRAAGTNGDGHAHEPSSSVPDESANAAAEPIPVTTPPFDPDAT